MTFELQPLDHGFTPAYVQIADQIRAAIHSGELAPGEPLPSQDTMATSTGVARMTVNQALTILKGEGLLLSQRGKPTTVMPTGSVPVLPHEVVGSYLASRTPGGLRAFDLSLEEIQGILTPAVGPKRLFSNERHPLLLLIRPDRDAREMTRYLEAIMSTFSIRMSSEETDVPPFLHMQGGETFMRLGREGGRAHPDRWLHFTLNRREGDPLHAWFQDQWDQSSLATDR